MFLLRLNPKTARAYGLHEGQRAVLSTPKGKAKVKIHLFDGYYARHCRFAERVWAIQPTTIYLAGKGINFNELIGPVEDPDSGLDAAWGIRAKLAKA